MKKIFILAILASVVCVSTVSAQQRKKRVAIMDFDYGTVHAGVSEIFGQDVDVGKGIADLLVNYLVKDGTYSVIERKALDKILAEQNFSNSDRANPASAAKIGKMLGIDAMIVGSITQFGNDTKNTKIGGAGGGLGGFGLGGFGHKKSKAIVGLDARIVDIDTGEILAVAEGKGESQRTSTSMLGGGGNWHGFGAGGVDFGSSDFQNTIIGEATKAAVEQMSTRGDRRRNQAADPSGHRGRPGGSGRQRPDHPQRRREDRVEGWRSTQRGAGHQGNQRSRNR